MDNSILYIILFLVFLLASALFSSSETAFISLQRIRLKHLERTGVAEADRVATIMKKPEKFLTTILTGNNFVNTAAAALATAIAVSLWREEVAVILATIVVTILLLIFGEVVPKTIATQHSEKVALFYARPVTLVMWLLSPVAAVLSWIGTSFAKLVRGTPASKVLVTEEEIRTMISVGVEEGVVEEEEAKMLHNVFEFGDHPVHEAMTPRPEIAWIEEGTKLKEFLAIYSQSPHFRFPVYRENTDNVIGVLSIKDVIMAQSQGRIDPESSLDDLIRPMLFVPGSKRIGKTFAEMQSTDNQMAAVVDEFGGIDGIVTLEQLLEEIVGRIGDELKGGAKEFIAIDERTFEVDGGMRVEEANEEVGLNLPLGDYETVGGFVLACLGHIPKEGEQLKYNDLRLLITKMSGRRVEKLRVSKEGA